MSARRSTATAPDRGTLRLAPASRATTLGGTRAVADLAFGVSGAVAVRSEDVPPSVVARNSRVPVRTDAERERTVGGGASDLGWVSACTPAGAALLGRRTGEGARCDAPASRVRFWIETVVHQPEASGSDALAA